MEILQTACLDRKKISYVVGFDLNLCKYFWEKAHTVKGPSVTLYTVDKQGKTLELYLKEAACWFYRQTYEVLWQVRGVDRQI